MKKPAFPLRVVMIGGVQTKLISRAGTWMGIVGKRGVRCYLQKKKKIKNGIYKRSREFEKRFARESHLGDGHVSRAVSMGRHKATWLKDEGGGLL